APYTATVVVECYPAMQPIQNRWTTHRSYGNHSTAVSLWTSPRASRTHSRTRPLRHLGRPEARSGAREHRGDDRRDRQRQRGTGDEWQERIGTVEKTGDRTSRSESERERDLIRRVALRRARRRNDALHGGGDDRVRRLRRPEEERRDPDKRLRPPRKCHEHAGRGHHARGTE